MFIKHEYTINRPNRLTSFIYKRVFNLYSLKIKKAVPTRKVDSNSTKGHNYSLEIDLRSKIVIKAILSGPW
jgi:hypothetical protein